MVQWSLTAETASGPVEQTLPSTLPSTGPPDQWILWEMSSLFSAPNTKTFKNVFISVAHTPEYFNQQRAATV